MRVPVFLDNLAGYILLWVCRIVFFPIVAPIMLVAWLLGLGSL